MDIYKLQETITKTMNDWNIPGVAIAIIDNENEFVDGFGFLSAGKPERVNADTLFAIGSTSKAFTSALIGMLVDEGKLNWDDPVV